MRVVRGNGLRFVFVVQVVRDFVVEFVADFDGVRVRELRPFDQLRGVGLDMRAHDVFARAKRPKFGVLAVPLVHERPFTLRTLRGGRGWRFSRMRVDAGGWLRTGTAIRQRGHGQRRWGSSVGHGRYRESGDADQGGYRLQGQRWTVDLK